MIIQEVTEANYENAILEGQTVLDNKFNMVNSFANVDMNIAFNKEKFGRLMQDPTMFSYALLKDKQGDPLKLKFFQDISINDRNRFIQIVAANQMGKTWTMVVKALHHAFYVNNAYVVIISRSEDQAIYILDEIKQMMRRSRFDFSAIKDEIENRTELHIKSKDGGTSVIRCVPPTTSALGFAATLIICDEQAFWEIKVMDDIKYFYQVVETRTNFTKNLTHPFLTMGQVCCISNPDGQRGIFWHLWKEDLRFHSYRYCWLANDNNKRDEWDAKKPPVTPSDIFDSSYAAEFNRSAGNFIESVEYSDSIRHYDLKIPKAVHLFLGGDFAGEDTKSREVDLTVLIGVIKVEGRVRLVYYNKYPKRVKKKIVYNDIKDLAKKNVIMFGYDKVGVGDSVKNDLIDNHILTENQIVSLTYSLPNKSEVYWNLKHLFEQRKIEMIDIPEIKEQLLSLQFEKTGGGYLSNGIMQSHIKIHHRTEKIHDDIADAFANACYVATREGMPDYEYKWIPKDKVNSMDTPKPKTYNQRVLCADCGHDRDFNDIIRCPSCGVEEKSKILDYCREEPIFVNI